MPWSRHDFLFRRNALPASGSIPRRKAIRPRLIGSSLIGPSLIGPAVIGLVSLVVASVCPAQSFTPIGPRYAGEVILSERVVSPRAEPLPAPKQSPKPTLSIAGKEPVSLSDGGKQSELPLASQTPIFALGNDVWKRMLDLERENADLKAELEYERKLASYIERSETYHQDQSDLIAKLEGKLAEMKRSESEWDRESERAETKLRSLSGQNQTLEKRVQQLEKELQRSRESKIAQSPKKKSRRVADADELPMPAPGAMPARASQKRGPETVPAKREKIPVKKKKSDETNNAAVESGAEPVGAVSLAVIPVGFEITGGLVKPIQDDAGQTPAAARGANENGLQGGPRGPLGR